MGHFSHTCKLTGIPITGGTPVALFPMIPNTRRYENSEEELAKKGTSYQCSNDGPFLQYYPSAYPIFGRYDDYGGIERIVKDDNTDILEEYFGLDIQRICKILTRGDEASEEEMKLPKVKELIKTSSMWIHLRVYEKLVSKGTRAWDDKIDLGNAQILKALGFKKFLPEDKEKYELMHSLDDLGVLENSQDSRYNMRYHYKGIPVNSDGTWLQIPKKTGYKGSVYSLVDLAKYIEFMGGEVDKAVWKSINDKCGSEQFFDYLVPTLKKPIGLSLQDLIRMALSGDEDSMREASEFLEIEPTTDSKVITDAISKKGISNLTSVDLEENVKYKFLDFNRTSGKKSKLSQYYITGAIEGKLRENLVGFWRFNHYMMVTGTYYAPVGTAPQDGEHESVFKVLSVAKEVLSDEIEERKSFAYDEDEENYF